MSLSDYFYSPQLEDQEQTKLSKAQVEEAAKQTEEAVKQANEAVKQTEVAVKQTKYSKGTFWVSILILLLTIVLVLREFEIF